MKKRRKVGRKQPPQPILSNKLDHRLLRMFEMRMPELRKMKQTDHTRFQEHRKELEELEQAYARTKDRKRRLQLEDEYQERISGFPVPLTFGLYFPEHAKKEVAKFTKIKKPFISGLIESDANVRDLKKLGVEVRNQAGNIFTANIPFDLIKRLAAMSAIDYIEIGRPNYSDLGAAVPYAQLDTLHSATPAVTGSNVIVGIVDTHMDVYHVDFRNNDGVGGDGLGSTRILFLWHQWMAPNASESGPPVAPALPGFNPVGGSTYGTEYAQATINAELNNYAPPTAPTPQPAYQTVRHAYGSTASLINSHGTHVAGCATGNGRSGNVGAAPGADIIYVQLGGGSNYVAADQSTLSDAFSYVFARAAALSKPCVVNRSGSDNMGPHDGKTLGEQFLDNLLLTSGRAITFAAGNTDNKNSHVQGTVPSGGNTAITCTYSGTPNSNDQIEIWYDGHDTISATLTIPDAAGTVIGPIAPGTTSAVSTLANGNTVQIVHGLNDPRNNDNVITIFIGGVSSAAPIVTGGWAIQLTGTTVINGNFASWVDRNNRGSRTWGAPVSGNMTIATPATSLRSIAVGSHGTDPAPPDAAGSSSAGPTRDGRVKPDIAANGLSVVAARSEDKNNTSPGGLTSSKNGTSMAAPIVAGACACLFECKGAALNWFDLKQILWDRAGSPAVGIPSNKFGFGYLQMGTACTAPDTDVDVWLKDHSNDMGDEPFVGDIAWLSPDVEIQDLARNPVANPTHNPANLINNLVEVTVRNKGTQTARNLQVFLYWADPATSLPFPGEWRTTGIYTGDPNWIVESNMIVVPQLGAGLTTTVTFGWAPPAPGTNIRGDDHFCLLIRLETEADPSNVNAGGWPVIRGSNNIALRNTHVLPVPTGPGDDDAETAFYVIGTDDIDGLWIDLEDLQADVALKMPVQALVYRDAILINKHGKRASYGQRCGVDPLKSAKLRLKRHNIEVRTGITGAEYLEIMNGVVCIHKSPGERLFIPQLNIVKHAKMPVQLRARKVKLKRNRGFVHVGQYSGGRRATGVTMELRAKMPRKSKFLSYKEGDTMVIEKVRR